MTAVRTSVTPYAAAKIVNAALAEAGLTKAIPPQMMYNYTTGRLNKGKVPYIPVDADGKITVADLQVWLTAYLGKQAPADADPEQAEFDRSES